MKKDWFGVFILISFGVFFGFGFVKAQEPIGTKYTFRHFLLFEEKQENWQTLVFEEIFKDDFLIAKTLYPEKPTQILVARKETYKHFEKTILAFKGDLDGIGNNKVAWGLLAGNPKFCDREGCSLFALYLNSSGFWEIVWEIKSTGHVFILGEVVMFNKNVPAQPNYFGTVIANENPILGCEYYNSKDFVIEKVTGEPCDQWPKRYADHLGFLLEKEFKSFGVKASAYGSTISQKNPKEYHILVGFFEPEVKNKVTSILEGFAKSYNLKVNDFEEFFRLEFNQERVLYYYQMPTYSVVWTPEDY